MAFIIIAAVLIVLALLAAFAVYHMFLACAARDGSRLVTEIMAKALNKNMADDIEEIPLVKDGEALFSRLDKEPVSITSRDGLVLRGWFIPAEGAVRTIMCVHGYRASALSNFAAVIPFYRDIRSNLLLIEQRACGISEGDYITFGQLEQYDCIEWLKYLETRIGPSQPVFLDGISLGSSTVLMMSKHDLPCSVRGIICDSGYTSARDEFIHLIRQARAPARPAAAAAMFLFRKLAGVDLDRDTPLRSAADAGYPVMFVHGESDTFVPTWMGRANFDACTSPKELHIFPGAEHGMSYLTDTPRAQKALAEFFEKYGS